MNRTRYVVVTTTAGSAGAASALASLIIRDRLAACVQLARIRSVYRWKGKIESAAEFRLDAKTRASLAARLRRFIHANHSYEVPEIITTPITAGLPAYLAWIENETLTFRRSNSRKTQATKRKRDDT